MSEATAAIAPPHTVTRQATFDGRARLAYAAALLSVLGWGSLYTAAKPALREVTPAMVAGARASVACLALSLLYCVRAGGVGVGLRRLRQEFLRDTRGACALGLVSFVGTSLIAMTAQQLLPASINGLLNNLGPLWLALYASVAGRARSAPLLLAGSAVAAIGVATVLLGDAALAPLRIFGPAVAGAAGGLGPAYGLHGKEWLGALISLGGSMLIAYSGLLGRRVLAGRDALAVTALATGWAALPLLAALAFGWGGSLGGYVAASLPTKGLLLWLGLGSTAFNFALWYFALAHLPITRVINFQYLIPPLGVVLALVFLREPAGPGLLVGTLLIVGGIVVAQRGAERTPPAAHAERLRHTSMSS